MSFLSDSAVLICDFRGQVIWSSKENDNQKTAQFAWSESQPEDIEKFKSMISRSVAFGTCTTGEIHCRLGPVYRVWVWPLNSAEMSVCILGCQFPKELSRLSPSERKLMGQMSIGKSVRQLAQSFEIKVSTVHSHLRRIREKLKLESHEAVFSFAGKYCSPLSCDQNDATGKTGCAEFPTPAEDLQLRDQHKGTCAAICDWQGNLVWKSNDIISAEVGEPVWKFVSDQDLNRAKESIARVVTLREFRYGEGFGQKGEYYRIFGWPLLSHNAAVFLLVVSIPSELSELNFREREMLNMLAEGMATKMIASHMDVSSSTVHSSLKTAREKLGICNLEALTAFASRYCRNPTPKPMATVK